MPIFKAKLSDGRTVTLEGDHKPTEEEILSAVQGYKPDKAPTPQSLESPKDEILAGVERAFAPIESERKRQQGFPAYLGRNLLDPVNRALTVSPADIANEPRNYPEAAANKILQQINPLNAAMVAGGGTIAKLPGAIANLAKAAIGSLFAKQMTEAGAQAAGERLAGVPLTPEEKGALDAEIAIGALPALGVVSAPKLLKGKDYASGITKPESVSELEVRPRMGEETSLRQQGEVAGTRTPIRQEPQQGTEVPQEKVVATPLTPSEQAIEQARLAESEQGVGTEPKSYGQKLAEEAAAKMKADEEAFKRNQAGLSAKPEESLPSLVKRIGRQKVEELIGDWDIDARLSPDGKFITTFSDPRNQAGKIRASSKDFMSWVAEKQNKGPVPSEPAPTPSPVLPEGTLEKAGKATTLPAPSISVTPKTGKTQAPLEILNSAKQVKVTAPKSATMVRVTDENGKTATQSLASIQGENVFQGAGITKIEAGIIGKDKKFKPVKGEVTVEDKTPIVTTPLSRGPGAAAAGEPGTYSPIQRMADELRVTADKSAPVDSQISAIQIAKNKLSGFKDTVVKSLSSLRAIKDAMWEKWKGLPEYGDEQRAVGKWFRALQQADHEARNFAKVITKEVPNKLRREAITNWIQAEGNEVLLRERAAASKGSIKTGYELATRLTEREKQIAVMLRDYYDQQLQNGIQAGILKDGLENYITQVWKRENPVTKKLISELSYSKLSPNFKYARKRIFDSYFEGEQSGFKPNKDAGFLVANYDQAFNKSLAARAFIKDLHEGKASDGRPLVEISGNGKLVDEGEANPTVLINPHAKPEEISDYRTIDHPALRGWKWATKTPDGKNVFVKGDMLVHPEAYQKLKNRLSVSAFRQNPITRGFMRGQTTIKQTMLSVSGFHQVQETLHALGHRVNPANLPEIDFSEPVTRALAEHGLQLSDYNALDSFSEGLAGGSLTSKIPIVGSKLHAYNEWLFQDYIPRLKLQMSKLALERNAERYPKLSQDKLLELTAKEANAAFGELPYRYWGRSPTLQDALRAFILAPDFLEARTRFVGRALRPYGREQLVALGILAATQYITARIVNQIVDDDPHFETKNTFRIVAGNHAYGLRTIPADLIHLFSDSRGFFYNRMSPMLRTAFEAVSGRDDRGVKKDVLEQAKDFAKMPIPISIKPRLGNRWWETFLNAFGIQEQRYDAVQNIRQKSAEFKRQNNIVDANETIYNAEKDPYESLKIAIQEGDRTVAKSQFDKLKATIPQAKILLHFKDSLNRPFTGSKANDIKFYNSLDEEGKRQFQEAKDLNNARLKMVQSLAGRESSW